MAPEKYMHATQKFSTRTKDDWYEVANFILLLILLLVLSHYTFTKSIRFVC